MVVSGRTQMDQPVGTWENIIVRKNNQIAIQMCQTGIEGDVLA
jgi:hypothetical protein